MLDKDSLTVFQSASESPAPQTAVGAMDLVESVARAPEFALRTKIEVASRINQIKPTDRRWVVIEVGPKIGIQDVAGNGVGEQPLCPTAAPNVVGRNRRRPGSIDEVIGVDLKKSRIRLDGGEHYVERPVLQGPRLKAQGARGETSTECGPKSAKQRPQNHAGVELAKPNDRAFSFCEIPLNEREASVGAAARL